MAIDWGIRIRPMKTNELIYGVSPTKKGVSKAILKRIVWKRDKGVCQLCHIKIRQNEVWDLARNRAGRPYAVNNTFVAHHDCNISQGRKTRKRTLRQIGASRTTKRKAKKRTPKRKRSGRYPYNPITGRRERVTLFRP